MNYNIQNAESPKELNAILKFAEGILGKQENFDFAIWEERMNAHPELILYAETDGNIIGITPSFLEENGNITVGIVAVDEKYRKQGIAKALLSEVERRAWHFGAKLIALGSAETAEGFYQKLGYTGQLLIQSEKHTVDELLKLNPGYPVVFINVYDGKIHQLCLKLSTPDRDLQKLFESTFADCHTQTMFWKRI